MKSWVRMMVGDEGVRVPLGMDDDRRELLAVGRCGLCRSSVAILVMKG